MLWEKSIVGLNGRPDSEGNPPDVVGDVRLTDGVHVLARQDGGSHVADGVRGQGQHLVAADLQNVANLAKVRLIPNDVSRRHLKEIKDLSVMDGDGD